MLGFKVFGKCVYRTVNTDVPPGQLRFTLK